MDDQTERAQIIEALYRWIKQRPGLEFGNYGDVKSYRAELRSITKDLNDARVLLRYVELNQSITAEMLKEAFRGAFSGRLSWADGKLEYCTGQYWPTEYRRAACAVLASAVWYWWRDHCMPAPDHIGELGDRTYKGKSAGDWLRSNAGRMFGRSIAQRWFR